MRSALRGLAHQLAVRMRIDMVIIIIAQLPIISQLPINHVPCTSAAMHHAPATALAPRVCTLVPFIIVVTHQQSPTNYNTSEMLGIVGRA